MELTQDQIVFIAKDLKEKGLSQSGFTAEVMDHVCCSVEKKMRGGKDFHTSYKETIDLFGKNEIQNLQADVLQAKGTFIFVDETLAPKNTFYKKSKEGVEFIALRRNAYVSGVLGFFFIVAASFGLLNLNNNVPLSYLLLGAALITFTGLLYNFLGQSMISIKDQQILIYESRFPFNYKKKISKIEKKKCM